MNRTYLLVVSLAACLTLLAACSGSAPTETKTAETPGTPEYFTVDAKTAGSITGKVTYTGPKPRPKRIQMNEEAACARMHKGGMTDEELVVNADGTLANVFVYLKVGMEGKTFAPATDPVTIDQKGCRFEPHVFGIRTGQVLKVVNSDPVSHNIHPMPTINREWNQGQSPGAEPLEREFTRPEIMIPIKCNVHSWMRSYVSVVEHPYFTVTGDSGTFELKNVPPGNYTVEARHEKLGPQEVRVALSASASGTADFIFQGK